MKKPLREQGVAADLPTNSLLTPDTEIDAAQALLQLELLGKSERTARLRAFPHKDNPNKSQIGARAGNFDLYTAQQWQNAGCGVYLVINEGGDTNDSITSCLAFFYEHDDRPKDWQLEAWRQLGYGRPTFQVDTGGKSIHSFYVLMQPISRAMWRGVQARLLDHADADRSLKNESRVMRLAGAHYIGPVGQRVARSNLLNVSGDRYDIHEIESWLPAEHRQEQRRAPRYPQAPRHTLKELADALAHIPPRPTYKPNNRSNTYETYRNVLWGLVAACKDLGFDEQTAIALMEAHSPSRECGWNIPQVARTAGSQVSAGSFFYHAKQHGWRPNTNV